MNRKLVAAQLLETAEMYQNKHSQRFDTGRK